MGIGQKLTHAFFSKLRFAILETLSVGSSIIFKLENVSSHRIGRSTRLSQVWVKTDPRLLRGRLQYVQIIFTKINVPPHFSSFRNYALRTTFETTFSEKLSLRSGIIFRARKPSDSRAGQVDRERVKPLVEKISCTWVEDAHEPRACGFNVLRTSERTIHSDGIFTIQ